MKSMAALRCRGLPLLTVGILHLTDFGLACVSLIFLVMAIEKRVDQSILWNGPIGSL